MNGWKKKARQIVNQRLFLDLENKIAEQKRNARDPASDDMCSPGFRIYFKTGKGVSLGSEDKRVIAKAMKEQYSKVKDARDEALKIHSAHLAELNTAKSMVSKYNTSLSSLTVYQGKVKEAEANVTTAKDALNKSDTAATAAAETVKQAQQDLHERILDLVDAKENVSEAKDNVASWQARVQEALRANETLAEWQKKLNASAEKESKSRVRLNQTEQMYSGLHEERKVVEARLDEAQKIFDIDREQYEEYIGPYPPPKAPTENIWWDALTDGKWHEDWIGKFF